MSESEINNIISADMVGIRTDRVNVDRNFISNDKYSNVKGFCFPPRPLR